MTTKVPRHKWVLHEGDYRAVPPTAVEKCAHCGVLTKKVVVKTSRVGLTTATFSWKDVPLYSFGGDRWVMGKPVCTGRVNTAAPAPSEAP